MNNTSISFSPEMQFLLSCLCPGGSALKEFSKDNIDWDKLQVLIERHRVAPIVYSNLNEKKCSLADDFRKQLKMCNARNTGKSLLLTSELIRLASLFKENGIQIIAFKGPVLAEQIYGDVARRHAGDLDILVAPDQFQQADQLLCLNGYAHGSLLNRLSPKQFGIFKKLYSNMDYSNDNSPVHVELHWRLMSMQSYFYLDYQSILQNSIEIEIGNFPIQTLSLADHLLLLFVHGAQHGWFRLKWLCDILQVISTKQFSEWEELIQRAKEFGVHRAVYQGLILVQKLFDINIKVDVPVSKSMVNFVNKALVMILHDDDLTSSSGLNKFRYAIYRSLLRRDLKYKIDLLIWRFRTSRYDWQLINLPDKFFFLYYLFRPVFLIIAFMNKKYFQTRGLHAQ